MGWQAALDGQRDGSGFQRAWNKVFTLIEGKKSL